MTVWHRTPAGDWSIFVDGPRFDTACPRYFGPATRHVARSHIDVEWTGPTALRVRLDEPMLDFQLVIGAPRPLRWLNAVNASMPFVVRRSRPYARLIELMELMARWLLDMGGKRTFVLTHEPPHATPEQDENLTFTFVTDGVEPAIAQATAAAQDKAVQVVGGGNVVQQLLHAGLVDELHVDVMPVLLGAGLRLVGDSGLVRVQLERIGVQDVGVRTSLSFRVTK